MPRINLISLGRTMAKMQAIKTAIHLTTLRCSTLGAISTSESSHMMGKMEVKIMSSVRVRIGVNCPKSEKARMTRQLNLQNSNLNS